MPTQEDVRAIALGLPGAREDPYSFRFTVDGKLFVWAWLERVHPKRARLANRDVIAVRVEDELAKHALLTEDESVFFTEAHYDGYPAVLVRLRAITAERLREVITDAWRARASRRRAAELEQPADGT